MLAICIGALHHLIISLTIGNIVLHFLLEQVLLELSLKSALLINKLLHLTEFEL